MKIIDHESIVAAKIAPLEAYEWVKEVLAQKPSLVLPPKVSMHTGEHIFYNVMPCILPNEDRMGVKIITRHPEKTSGPNLTSQILIYELSSGSLLAVLDGSYITAMRTGAVAAHSAYLFANQDFSSVGMLGLGVTAAATMEILSAIEPERDIKVNLLRYKHQAESFCSRFQSGANLHFCIYDTPEQVIRASEVIISCVTFMDHNFAEDNTYQPGCTVIPVHSMGFQNCDLFFDKVFVDDIAHVRDFKYFEKFKALSEVSAVLRGESMGREHPDQRILVYNVGLAIHDIYFANKMLDRVKQAEEKDFNGPLEKMWMK